MESYTKSEKVKTVVEIIRKLQKFPSKYGTINLYNDQYSFFDDFKTITNEWIHNDTAHLNGFIKFEELNKNFEYLFPCSKNQEPLFVLRKT